MAKYFFEWDDEKDIVNQKRHGVAFVDAQEAFYDKNRVITHDEAHSEKEERLFLYWQYTKRCSYGAIYGKGSPHSCYWCREMEKMEENI